MDNKKITTYSLLHSLGVVIYILIVAFIIWNAENVFGNMNNILGPVAFLMLFTVSAAITGLLVFGRPVYLFLNGLKKEAIRFTFYTVGWLVVEAVLVFLILIIFNSGK
ncbi:MAG: hypothetical protein WCV50_06055 [Patescibacteria group bacterium]|jgi:hypothetical protein